MYPGSNIYGDYDNDCCYFIGTYVDTDLYRYDDQPEGNLWALVRSDTRGDYLFLLDNGELWKCNCRESLESLGRLKPGALDAIRTVIKLLQ